MTDRDRLIELVCKGIQEFSKSTVKCSADEYIADYLLANDFTKVVRCKDCKHRTNKGICEKFRQRYPFFPEDDFYCGFGELKEREG